MRILIISNHSPFPKTSGVAVRNSLFIEALAHTHTVDMLIQEYEGEQLPAIFNQVFLFKKNRWSRLAMIQAALSNKKSVYVQRFKNTRVTQFLSSIINRDRYDLIIAEALPAIVNVPHQCPVPIWLDQHNIEHIIYQEYEHKYKRTFMKSLVKKEVGKLAVYENNAMYRASILSVCSAVDKLLLDEGLQKKCKIIENTCAEAAQSNDIEVAFNDQNPLIVYSGTMNWHPNIDACHFFLDQIYPTIQQQIPRVRFAIVGKDPDASLLKKVESIEGAYCTGFVPDVGAVINEASLSIVPLRMGSGTRIKIIESARVGLPVVSTKKGAEGLNFKNGNDLLIADTPDVFAEHVVRVLQNSTEWKQIAENSKGRFLKQYNRTILMNQIQKVVGDRL